ncbi:hypothetical protein [Martelella radicis]|uniref:Uncharacterized protein n=1 Tax=Martelella radicis TaxID=1397476 RepID=A0A7W6P9I6_9HYPH|nr:hypothetical protein [Martelella radicis]MBB4120564.1 hypothetical protein [Martelella radicis]
MTIVPSPDYPAYVSSFGRAAHITAASKNGPRFEANLTASERKSADNGIWLCADCADLIDKNSGDGFSPELLRSWKASAEQEVSNASLLRTAASRPVWLDKLRSPHYVNVPRVLHLSEAGVLSPETRAMFNRGFPEDGFIAPQLYEVSTVLRLISIKAIDVEQILQPEKQVAEGLTISFYRRCRTKNGANTDKCYVENYSFEKSPLIYAEAHAYRYVFPYDPIWLTTMTARGSVRQGTAQLAGLGIVKHVDQNKRSVISTPLAFGIPDLLGLFG